MPISNWSTTPANNNGTPPNGAPEGMAPNTVNDIMRQQMADHKTQWLEGEWFNHGDTVSRASATTFKIAADVTDEYLVHRRIKCYDSTTLYATVTAASYSAPDTTITVALESSSLTASLSSVALATCKPTNISIPSTIGRKGADIASATTTDIGAATGDFVDVTGTTTITGLGTIAAGVMRTVRFTGALTLTHNGTSLILPGAANITTAANDIGTFRSLGSGNWVCTSYTRAAGSDAPFIDSTAIIKGSADATKKLRIEVDALTTATTRVLTMPDQDIDLTPATQAQQEAATASNVFVTPSVQHYHPSANKVGGKITVSGGTVTLNYAYNCTVTDSGVGTYLINHTVAFSSAHYALVASYNANGVANEIRVEVGNFGPYAAGSVGIRVTTTSGTPTDIPNVAWMGMGDQ